MQGAKSEHRYDCPNSYFFRTLGGRGASRGPPPALALLNSTALYFRPPPDLLNIIKVVSSFKLRLNP